MKHFISNIIICFKQFQPTTTFSLLFKAIKLEIFRKPCGAMEAHQTSNLGVLGSSPSRVVKFFFYISESAFFKDDITKK